MRDEVKKWAKEHNKGNKWNIWKALLLIGVISGVASIIITLIAGDPNKENASLFSIALSDAVDIAMIPLTVGLIAYVVNIVKEKKIEIGQIFSKYKDFLRIFISNFFAGIIIILFSLLLIVPGIIRAISYSLINYILADEDFNNLGSSEILDLSKKLMYGHKSDYFMMCLYYFAMMLLGIFTLGILWIWIIPEFNLATAKFATNLLEEHKKKKA